MKTIETKKYIFFESYPWYMLDAINSYDVVSSYYKYAHKRLQKKIITQYDQNYRL